MMWKVIDEAPRYEVSTEGQVRRRDTGRLLCLNSVPSGNGGKAYYQVSLSLGHNVRIMRRVNRLVAAAFIGPIPPGYEVDHINGDRLDNTLRNLEIVTPSENQRRAYHKLIANIPKGEKQGSAKLTEAQVRCIRARFDAGESPASIAADFAVSRRNVAYIGRRQAWRHLDC